MKAQYVIDRGRPPVRCSGNPRMTRMEPVAGVNRGNKVPFLCLDPESHQASFIRSRSAYQRNGPTIKVYLQIPNPPQGKCPLPSAGS